MQLYSYWRSTAAYRVRIVLNLKGLDYEVRPVNLLEADDTLPYRELNPQGLVPTLVHEGNRLFQSTAIVEYLEELRPEPRLLPVHPVQRAVVRGMCQIVACDIHPLNNLRVLQYLRGDLHADDAAVNRWYAHWIAEGLRALEAQVAEHRGRYCAGDVVSLADAYLVPQLYNARRFDCDVAPYPNLTEIAAGLEAHPAFQAAAPDVQPDAPQPA